MADTGERGLSPLQAFETVMGFARRRGEPALRLAMHAAVPQVLHVDLLHLLCVNFVATAHRAGVVETDVMFSPFCRDLGNGYFRFDDNARLQLLQQLDAGPSGRHELRALQVADFLLAYFERQRASERGDVDPLYRSWLEVERWNALAFRDPEATAEQLAAAVEQACTPGQTSARLRVGTLAASLAPQLVRHEQLLRYAAGVEAVQSGAADAPALLRALGSEALQVGSVSLPPASAWLPAVAPPTAPQPPPPAEAESTTAPPGAAPPAADAPRQHLRGIADCEYTAFISYAHADDEAWFGWVTQFRNELERGLQALLRGVRLPRLHLAGHNGSSPGRQRHSGELSERLAASFALIVVVHDNYAQSDWCLQELRQYRALYGEEALRGRLYIVALSEPAMQQLTQQPAWGDVFAGLEPVWLPFYDPASTDRPLDIYLAQGLVSPAFRLPFERLRSDFAAKLKRSALAGQAQGSQATSMPPPAAAEPGPQVAGGTWPVVFGIVPAGLATAAAEALAALQRSGLGVGQLSMDAVFSDFGELGAASHLVLPYDDQPPLMATLHAGGHLGLQRDAWLKRGKPAGEVHWLDLRPEPTDGPAQGAAAWVESLGVGTLKLPELVRALAGGAPTPREGPDGPATLYIESNRNERTLWEPLGALLRERWLSLAIDSGQVPPRPLRVRGLPMDQIHSLPTLDEADGVVLLWGRKTSEALVAQINKVENKMGPGRDAAPGIVAYLMPPQRSTEPVPAWGWQVLRFEVREEAEDGAKGRSRPKDAEGGVTVACVPAEVRDLDLFLRKVLERRLRRGEAEPAR